MLLRPNYRFTYVRVGDKVIFKLDNFGEGVVTKVDEKGVHAEFYNLPPDVFERYVVGHADCFTKVE